MTGIRDESAAVRCKVAAAPRNISAFARDDLMTPAYFSEDIVARISKAEFVLLDGGGHACSKTEAQEFDRHVLDFIARHE